MLTRWFEAPAIPRDLLQTFFDDTPFRLDRRIAHAAPRFNVSDLENEVLIRAELPGLTEKELSITVENDRLTVRGERALDIPEGYRVQKRERPPLKFSQTFTFSNKMNLEATEAKLENGVLTVRIPKRPEAQPREIPVKAS